MARSNRSLAILASASTLTDASLRITPWQEG